MLGLRSFEFDNVEALACEHNRTFLAIATLLLGFAFKYAVSDWLVGMVRTSDLASVEGVVSYVDLVMILGLTVKVCDIHVYSRYDK